jgi:hypothetical protein
LVGVGCAEGGPPFDELALRDALRADPDAIAAMPDEARARLAARLEAARASDTTGDEVPSASADPRAVVTAADEARASRGGEALIVGAIAGGRAQPTPTSASASASAGDARVLPPLEGTDSAATARLEGTALTAAAKPPLLALLAASSARRLVRVTGWPVGAVAIGDAVYVNAAWLVALAPAADPDAGASTTSSASSASIASIASSASTSPTEPPPSSPRSADAPDGGAEPTAVEARSSALSAAGTGNDGGLAPPSPADYQCGASCADACAGDTSDDGSDDSCSGSTDDGGGDSCGGSTDDGGGDSCSGAADDGGDAACTATPDDGGCQIGGRPRSRRRPRDPGTVSFMLAPLAYLLSQRRP